VVEVKMGDLVRHKTKNYTGRVAKFKRHNIVLVDLSDKSGVMFRTFRIQDLEVVNEEV
tara:strand:- start:436 stop:609 length:174 start_codon:yes stop_codon:yes gene_type:complete